MGDSHPWVDPFAGMYSPAHIRNDINPNRNAEFHLDAVEFLKTLDNNSVAGVLNDPPFSTHQFETTYNDTHTLGATNPTSTEYKTAIKVEVNRILRPGGIVISLGWNSNGCSIYKKETKKLTQLEKLEVLLVAHGMAKNDTIITVEQKVQETLEQ